MMAHAVEVPVPPRTHRPELPDDLDALILGLLAKQTADRPTLDEVGALFSVRQPLSPLAGPERNGHQLVRVPKGPFLYGEERRSVGLSGFRIERFPVTHRQFAAFLEATNDRLARGLDFLRHWDGEQPLPGQLDHPVVWVSLGDALAYAAWVGLRLPTEAEGETSARGDDGRRYPWGKATPERSTANVGQRRGPTAVDAHPAGASPYGVEDAAGNVREWTADELRRHPLDEAIDPRASAGPRSAQVVIRGGCWWFDDPGSIRCAARAGSAPVTRSDAIGFRCAEGPPDRPKRVSGPFNNVSLFQK